jgi:O-antigen ligase
MTAVAGRAGGLALLGLAALTLALIIATGGSLAAAAVPVLAASILFAALRAPLRTVAVGLLFLTLIADAPQDNPMDGYWRSPLYVIGQLLCSNWSTSFGIPGAVFTGMHLMTLLLLFRILRERPRNAPTASALRTGLAVFLGTVFALFAFGYVRGGAMGSATWQVRQLFFIPVFAYVLSEALGDYRVLGRVILTAALVKVCAGLYFYFAIALPRGLHPAFITSHSDTLLFCLAITLVFVRWLARPDPASLRRCLWAIPLIMTAVWLNNRRMAYVGLGAVLTAVWLLTPWTRAKRAAARLGFIAVPLFGAYVAAGWTSSAQVFRPVASIRTIVATRDGDEAADSSTRSREIENYNLSQTLRQHPLGTGLGHEYEEVVKGPDISKDFALYRYIPHNSVLWLLSAAGPFGFFLLWSIFVVGIYLAARAHRMASTPEQRMAALGALAAQTLFVIQAWGDMGTQNWSTTWLLAAALAVAGRVSVETLAWPSHSTELEPAWVPQG